jgi:hypothetical protein
LPTSAFPPRSPTRWPASPRCPRLSATISGGRSTRTCRC